MTECSDTMWLH